MIKVNILQEYLWLMIQLYKYVSVSNSLDKNIQCLCHKLNYRNKFSNFTLTLTILASVIIIIYLCCSTYVPNYYKREYYSKDENKAEKRRVLPKT